MIILMLEQWVSSLGTTNEDELMFGYVVSLLEVLVHAPAFWARLKQSEVLTRMVVRVQDAERHPDSTLKKKSLAVMRAIAAEKHSKIPDPIDLQRFRPKQVNNSNGQHQLVSLPQ